RSRRGQPYGRRAGFFALAPVSRMCDRAIRGHADLGARMQEEGSVGAGEWQGQTGQSWASEWRRTDRSFGMLTERLLQRSRDFGFSSALDIGCGAGELALAIGRGRPHCQVTGLDISPQLIEVARER